MSGDDWDDSGTSPQSGFEALGSSDLVVVLDQLERIKLATEQQLHADPHSRQLALDLGRCLLRIAEVHTRVERPCDAMAVLRRAIDILSSAAGIHTRDLDLRLANALAHLRLGLAERDWSTGLKPLQIALVTLRALPVDHPDVAAATQTCLGALEGCLAELDKKAAALEQAGDTKNSLQVRRRHQEALGHLLAVNPGAPAWRQQQARGLLCIADDHARLNQPEDARQAAQAAVEAIVELRRHHPSDRLVQREEAVVRNGLGVRLMRAGETAVALEAFDAARRLLATLVETDAEDVVLRRDLMVCKCHEGDALMALGRSELAAAAFTDAVEICHSLILRDLGKTLWQEDLATVRSRLAGALRSSGRLPAAVDALTSALWIHERLSAQASSPPNSRLARTYQALALLFQEKADRVQANWCWLGCHQTLRSMVAAGERMDHDLQSLFEKLEQQHPD